MSASLDKSLEDIISSNKKATKVKKGAKPAKVGKKVGKSNKKPIVSFKKAAAPKQAATARPAIDLSYATKVVAQGLPKDIKQDGIREFFQAQVGPVQTISLSYNEKGQFKGIATIIFKSNKSAALAVEKYNGAPIDGGSSKLKLELVIDPTKKPLASRISANKVAAGPVSDAKTKQTKLKQKLQQKKLAQKKAAKPAKKPVKKTKKTVEELDQEMADYFDN